MRAIKSAFAISALVIGVVAHAAPVFYNSEATFLAAAAGIPLTLENFETYSGADTTSITGLASGLNISSNISLRDLNSSNFCAGTSSCILFNTPDGGSLQTFTFDGGAVNAFGIFLGDLGTQGSTTLSFTTSTGATQSYSVAGLITNELYFGVVDTAAAFVSVAMTTSDLGDAVLIDNIRFGTGNAVPEPGTLALAGISLAALAAARRRKS